MKKFLAICLVFCNTVIFFPTELIKADDTNYFVVTAYYSPLVNQEYYLTGDYESEIRLNGRGTNGASGKEVFSGMLAAPKTYEF
ncbi:MAG: hypothetical protein LBQ24_03920 [Candidatus Peribacteria bacterium]|jgi:hypothetical protein|nr:hypothetical protein [Candidatus Peribacteria bacterium]